MAHKCEHNLAYSSWTENSGIIWWLSSWISTSLKSSTRLLMAPTDATSFWKQKSTIYSWLAPVAEDFVCAPASQALRGAYFFCVFVCGILCSGRRSSLQQSLEMRACEIESESAVCYWVCFVRTEQCVCVWQQHSNNLALCCLKTTVDSYFLAYVAIWCYWQEKFVFLNI